MKGLGNSWEKSNLFCILCGNNAVWYKRWNNTWQSPTPDCKYSTAICLLCISCGRSIQVAQNEDRFGISMNRKEDIIRELRLPKVVAMKNLKAEFEKHLKSIHKTKKNIKHVLIHLNQIGDTKENFLVPDEMELKESFSFSENESYDNFINKISKIDYNENDVYSIEGKINYKNGAETTIKPLDNIIAWVYEEAEVSDPWNWRPGEGGGVRGGDHSSTR